MNWKVAAILLVTVVCLAWVLWGVDPQVVASCVGSFSWGFLLPMAALYFGAHVLRCFRLRILLDVPLTFWRLLTVNSIGFLAINVIPLRFGELVRPYLLLEGDGIPMGSSLAAIFIERLLDMFMLLLMLLAVGLLVTLPPGGVLVLGVDVVMAGQRLAGGVVVAGALFCLAVVLVGEPVIRLTERLSARLLPGLADRIGSFLRHFRQGVRTLARAPGRALALLLLSLGMWVLTILGLWMVLLGAEQADLGLADALVTWALTLSGMTAAPTPGFFGSHEAACSAGLRLVGLEPSLAATLAVIIHLGQFGFTVGLGSLFTLKEGLSLRELVRRSRVADPVQEEASGPAAE